MKSILEKDLENIIERLGKAVTVMEGKTLLISGGAGFLGSYIINTVDVLNKTHFRKPCQIICIDNYITAEKLGHRTGKSIKYITHDVSKPFKLYEKVDYIIHAAGIASPIYYKKYPLQAIEVNTQGTKNLLEIAKKQQIKSFLYFSSSEIYGNPDGQNIPTPETYKGNVSSIGPRSCYDESKRLGEAMVVNYYDVYKIPVVIVRPFNVYGPGMKIDDYRVVTAFISNMLRNEPMQIHDTGKQTRTYCYVSDAITAFFLVLLKGRSREVYNVGNDSPEITTYDLANFMKKIFKSSSKLKLVSYPATYPQDVPQRRCPDLKKIKLDLGYKPSVDLETGLVRTFTWFAVKYSNLKCFTAVNGRKS